MVEPLSIANLTSTWETWITEVLCGRDTVPGHLEGWLGALPNSYPPASVTGSLPEPFLGRLDRRPAGVFLVATPGRAYLGPDGRPDFQSLTGVFAEEILELGSYSAWAASWAYVRRPWTSLVSTPNIHLRRLQFLRHWYGDDRLDGDDIVSFALYPWHTTGTAGRFQPNADHLWSFVFEPIVELGSPPIFTFGAPWFGLLPRLGFAMESVVAFGKAHTDVLSTSKSIALFRGPGGLQVIAEKHLGTPYPPAIEGVIKMQKALTNAGVLVS